MFKLSIMFFIFIYTDRWTTLEASCYFPQEFQGEFVMQSSASVTGGVQYSTLNITENSIPIWGNCHRRIGNNFILMLNYSGTSCTRCLHLKLRSTNVLQVFASNRETLWKCFTNEESAETNCPSEESLLTRETAEILLFKTKDNLGSHTMKEYCPIDGKYFVDYRGPKSRPNECRGPNSMVNLCPSGSGSLNFNLRNCTHDSYDLQLDCLGHWKGMNDEQFLIFVDSRHMTKQVPKYRCAIYKQNVTNGKIEMAVSGDSTCSTDIHNTTNAYETFTLTPKLDKPWPAEVSFAMCIFPKWIHGEWEHVSIQDETMIYRDPSTFRTYTIKCVGTIEDSDKYLVFTRTQCDEESYNCIRLANRSNNIFEFQIGTNTSKDKDVFTLCADENFQENSWITQGRLDIVPGQSSGMCPITGEYTGRIPDAMELCAKLWSDCRAPELMYYQVSHCDSEEIYEEREYQCLGHWRESSYLYTYTQRNDVSAGTYECFVGSIFTDNDIYIKEAGEHCQRNIDVIDPLRFGMKLVKKQPLYSCIERSTTPRYIPRSTTRKMVKTTATILPKRTTASQDFESNAIPKTNSGDSSSSAVFGPLLCLYTTAYMFAKLV